MKVNVTQYQYKTQQIGKQYAEVNSRLKQSARNEKATLNNLYMNENFIYYNEIKKCENKVDLENYFMQIQITLYLNILRQFI